jgi:hypothetical protein
MVRGGLSVLLLTATVHAATVKGTVVLPPAPRAPPLDAHWRVENGVLPIAPPTPDRHGEVVVVLDPEQPAKESIANTTVELYGLQLDPRIIWIGIGGSVDFKNADRVAHSLYLEHATSRVASLVTPAGQTRTQKFFAAGEYRVRDEEYPHVDGTVLVVNTPFVTRLDAQGTFKLDVPEGKYLLRLFWRDRWVTQRPITVGAHAIEINLAVPPSPGGKS